MFTLDLMDDPRVPVLSSLKAPTTHAMPSNNSTDTTGKAACSRFERTDSLALAWAVDLADAEDLVVAEDSEAAVASAAALVVAALVEAAVALAEAAASTQVALQL